MTHVRGRRFALSCKQEVLESREAMAERGERLRRGALSFSPGVTRSQEWLGRDKKRQTEILRRKRMREKYGEGWREVVDTVKK